MSPSSPLSFVPDGENSTLSSPLSNLSRTPSLPSSPDMPDPTKRYPSPSTTASGPHSPDKTCDLPSEDEIVAKPLDDSTSGPPPAKKRRISPPKERTTEYLDLMKPEDELTAEDRGQLKRLIDTLRKKKKIVVIAGAGISVSAGIPDFRSSTGLFATVKTQHNLKGSGKHLFDASVYKHDSTTQSFHAMVREMATMTKAAKPTPFHELLASLAQEGRLLRLYSQNIDCLDTQLKPLATEVPLNPKGPWPVTIQLHGGLQKMVCTKCNNIREFDGEVFDGPEAPLCPTCKTLDEVRTTHAGKRSHGIGRLRPRFVLYNEYNPDEDAIGNVSSADLKARPDAVLVVGTTLKVPGTRRLVREMCQVTRGRKNGTAIWINVDDEPKGADLKNCWDIVVRSKCDDVARSAALPPWNITLGQDYEVSEEAFSKSQEDRKHLNFSVEIPVNSVSTYPHSEDQCAAKSKQVKQVQGIPTPHASPKILAIKNPTKTMQTTISFDGKVTTEQPVQLSKQRGPSKQNGRKRKAPGGHKEAQLKGFKATKNIIGQEKAGGSASDPQTKRNVTGRGKNRHPLPSQRPTTSPHKEMLTDTKDLDEKVRQRGAGYPSTRTTKMNGTISPRSYPNNTRHLID
ncbi:NAD-dependent histone deacetylase [Fusarium globosum]|uniref:NAD-dependent histone deacetylase n=1 Tax=Fusarium globosum TaxID=78864 RepID=A0A8H5YNI1_9HYPO|nr:NAD-dependent histone deacetylase [Fusarium globosum]